MQHNYQAGDIIEYSDGTKDRVERVHAHSWRSGIAYAAADLDIFTGNRHRRVSAATIERFGIARIIRQESAVTL